MPFFRYASATTKRTRPSFFYVTLDEKTRTLHAHRTKPAGVRDYVIAYSSADLVFNVARMIQVTRGIRVRAISIFGHTLKLKAR